MLAQRMHELLLAYAETSAQELSQLERYLELLLRWNMRTNLTAVRDEEQIVRRHFGESLAIARWIAERAGAARTLFDLGSGAGFPGAVVAIACPGLQVTLIESQTKKAVFLKELVRTLELGNCRVHGGRAEELLLQTDARQNSARVERRADLITMRAVDRSEEMLRVARSLMNDDGRVLFLAGERQSAPELREEERVAGFGAVEESMLRGGVRVRVLN